MLFEVWVFSMKEQQNRQQLTVLEVETGCRLLKVPIFRGSSKFECSISSHHSRFNVAYEYIKEEINDDVMTVLVQTCQILIVLKQFSFPQRTSMTLNSKSSILLAASGSRNRASRRVLLLCVYRGEKSPKKSNADGSVQLFSIS